MSLYLNPNIFFFINNGDLIAWDYKNHNQFILSKKYFERICSIAKNENIIPCELDEKLIESNVIGTSPYPRNIWGWDILSLIYHIGTQDIGDEEEVEQTEWLDKYVAYCTGQKKPNNTSFELSYKNKKILPLPQLEKLELKSFKEVLQSRKTSRQFNGEPISLEELNLLLFTTFGKFYGEWDELTNSGYETTTFRRTSPSGGALHPVEPFVICYNVLGLTPGVYYYNSSEHALCFVEKLPTYQILTKMLYSQFFVQGIAIGIVFVGCFNKAWEKYPHSRTYKDIYLDCGHLSQTCLLTATSLNLKTWVTAWFRDSQLSSLLHVSGLEIAPLFFMGIGHGNGNALPKIDLIKENKFTPDI